MTIQELIDRYQGLLEEKDLLAEQTKKNNAAVENARNELAQAMIDEEVDSMTRNGYSYTLSPRCRYSKKAGADEELFDLLRRDGLGDLIKETVNAQTLQGAMSELVDNNEGALPEEYAEVISIYNYNDISRRRKATK